MRWPDDAIGLTVFAMAVALALAAAPLARGVEPGDPLRARVRRAFERTFQQPGLRSVELRVWRGGRLASRRRFDVAHRRDGPVARTLLRFTDPEYLRGHALLMVDSGDGASDTWLYQPEERRPRRVGTRQKADAFYGSDLSFEDLERPHWERWRLAAEGHAVEAIPPADSQYGRLRIWIEPRLEAVSRIDFFRGGDAEPAKRMTVALDGAVEERGHLRIAGLAVEVLGRAARTELAVTRMVIDPAVAERVFSAMRLEREGEDLFGLAGREDAR